MPAAVVLLLTASAALALGPTSTDWVDYPTDGDTQAECKGCGVYKLNAVHGRSRPDLTNPAVNDVWAVGDAGVILHFDGTNWTPYAPKPTLQDLNDVYINADGTGWACGDQGTVLQLIAGAWSCYNCPASCIAGGGGILHTCSNLYDIFPADAHGDSTSLFISGEGECNPPDSTLLYNMPTLLFWNGSSWQKLTDTPTGCGVNQYKGNPGGACLPYGFVNPVASPMWTCPVPSKSFYTGVMAGYKAGVIFESKGYFPLYFTSASSNWSKAGGLTIPSCALGYPAFYSSAAFGSYLVAGGDTDNCGTYPVTSNLFIGNSTAVSFTAINTGIVPGDYGTIRGMDFLPLWGFGIGVGWGAPGGADYSTARNDAYFTLFSNPDLTRPPADPASNNKVLYWQKPAAKTWPRLNGTFISNFNEAWAVGDNSTILHWKGPSPLPAFLDLCFSVTRIGMEVTIVMSVTNTGGSALKNTYPLGLDLSPSNGAVKTYGPDPAGPVSLPPTGPAYFTWSYSFTGYGNGLVKFTGTVTGVDAYLALQLTKGGSITVAQPLMSALSVEVSKSCSGTFYYTAILTVTNSGDIVLANVVPDAELTLSPGTAWKTTGPLPASFAGPLNLNQSTSFTWTYAKPGMLPTTVSGGVEKAENASDSTEIFWTKASRVATTVRPSPLDVGLLATPTQAGTNSYYFTLVMTVTNNGSCNLNNFSITDPVSTPSGAVILSGPVPVPAATLAALSSTTFTWTASMTGTLPIRFGVSAGGDDACTGLATCSTTYVQVNVAPGVMTSSITSRTYRLSKDTYQLFVDLNVKNTGMFTATAFMPSARLTISPGTVTTVYGPLLTGESAWCPVGPPQCTGMNMDWNGTWYGELAPGSSTDFTYSVLVRGNLPVNIAGRVDAQIEMSTLTPTYTVAQAQSGPVQPSNIDGALSISAEKVRAGLDYRWLLTVVLTVTSTAECAIAPTCPTTNFVPAPTLDVTPSGQAWYVDGPSPPAIDPTIIYKGQSRSFTWTYSATGTVKVTLGGSCYAYITGTSYGEPSPVYAYATATISLEDDGSAGGFSLDHNLIQKGTPVRCAFNLKEDGYSSMKVYNSIGQRVAVLWDGMTPRRVDIVRFWDGRSCQTPDECGANSGYRVGTGVYFVRVESNRFVGTRKVVVMK